MISRRARSAAIWKSLRPRISPFTKAPAPYNYDYLAALNPREKWLNVLLNEARSVKFLPFPKRAGDYFDCRRGIATGANDFFCLSRSALREHGLTDTHVEPCITKATDADGRRASGRRLSESPSSGRFPIS